MPEETNATVGAANETQGESTKQNQEGQAKSEGQKTKAADDQVVLSQSEYEKKLQAETDRRTEQALKTHREKWEKEYNARIEKERKDAERLAQLSHEEREKELRERKDSELTKKERLLMQRELKLTAIDVLAERNLPVNFADQLIGESAEDTHDRIKKFESEWHKAIEKEVNARLKSVVPKDGDSTENKPPDMNQILRSWGSARK